MIQHDFDESVLGLQDSIYSLLNVFPVLKYLAFKIFVLNLVLKYKT